jgi:hypothetical protein
MADGILATNQGSATAMGSWETYAPDDRPQQMPSVGTQAFGEQCVVDFFFERNLGHDGVAANNSSRGESGNR